MDLSVSLVLVSLLVLLSVSSSGKPQTRELKRRSTDVVRVERRPVMGKAQVMIQDIQFLYGNRCNY